MSKIKARFGLGQRGGDEERASWESQSGEPEWSQQRARARIRSRQAAALAMFRDCQERNGTFLPDNGFLISASSPWGEAFCRDGAGKGHRHRGLPRSGSNPSAWPLDQSQAQTILHREALGGPRGRPGARPISVDRSLIPPEQKMLSKETRDARRLPRQQRPPAHEDNPPGASDPRKGSQLHGSVRYLSAFRKQGLSPGTCWRSAAP